MAAYRGLTVHRDPLRAQRSVTNMGELDLFRSTQPCIPLAVAESSTIFGCNRVGKVTAAGWQVKLCDPIRHVISRIDYELPFLIIYLLIYFSVYPQKPTTWRRQHWT